MSLSVVSVAGVLAFMIGRLQFFDSCEYIAMVRAFEPRHGRLDGTIRGFLPQDMGALVIFDGIHVVE